MTVEGGNWQIFHGMVNRSAANVLLNTSVAAITRSSPDEKASTSPRYLIETTPAGTEAAAEEMDVLFDNVVIATPFQFSKIEAGDDVIQHAIDEIPYVSLHVTIFSSPFRLSRSFFNLTDSDPLPDFILTTLAKGDTPTSGVEGAGKAGFFSISIVRKAINSNNGKEEYIYKIFSPAKLTADFLS